MKVRNPVGTLSAGITFLMIAVVFIFLIPVLPHSSFLDVAWPALDVVYWLLGALLIWRYLRAQRS